MLVRHCFHCRMADAVKLAAVLSIAGAVVRTAYDKSVSSRLSPPVEQTAQLGICVAQGGLMALYGVVPGSVLPQIKPVGMASIFT